MGWFINWIFARTGKRWEAEMDRMIRDAERAETLFLKGGL
jgi:hypothetical protein